MPHHRIRYLENKLRKDLTWSRIVSVLGMRQAGKTTLIRQICPDYITLLDDESIINNLKKGNWGIIESTRFPLAIDEAQHLPSLFPKLKILADQINRPGMFVLSGSVRFLSKKAIRESLTGRISVLELLPMTLAESHEKPISALIQIAFKKSKQDLLNHLEERSWATRAQIDDYLKKGGMPGICFRREEEIRRRTWSAHLDTVLSRDLQLLRTTDISLIQLRALFSELARQQGEPINQSALARKIRVSAPTLKQLLMIFEALFLVRQHGNGYYCEDTGLACFAAGGKDHLSSTVLMSMFVFSQLKAEINYVHTVSARMSEFRTRGGAWVPFVINIPEFGTLALTIDPDQVVSSKSLQSLTAFSKKNAKCVKIAIHQGKNGYLSSTGIPCIPWTWIA